MVSPAASGSASKTPSSDIRNKSSKQSSAAASEVSIRLWPPGSRTRSNVAERVAENLKSLSAFYQPLQPDEAVRIAAAVEERAFEQGQQEDEEATRVSGNMNNGSSAVRVYAKQASRMMLEVLKTGKLPEREKPAQTVSEDMSEVQENNVGGEKDGSSLTTVVKDVVRPDTEDTASTTGEGDAQLFDISGGTREVLNLDKAREIFAPLTNPNNEVTKIRLSNWSFTKEAAEYASELLSKNKDQILEADLSDIVAGRPEAEALEVMTIFSQALEGSNLSSLNLSNNALGEKGVRAFSALLKSQRHLQELQFENNGISSDAAKAIVELVSGSKLRVLHFHNNMTGDAGAERLAELVSQAGSLEDFRLSSSRVGNKGAVAISEALKSTSSLQKLDLRDNIFGEEAGFTLGNALKQQQLLTELYLADLGLQDKGVGAVLEALESSAGNLSVLDLGNNEITVKCATQLAGFLKKKPSLRKLSLAENELKDKGVILISNALREDHDALEELDLTLNDFGSEGAIAAAKAVAKKPRFKLLVLESNHISAKGLEAVHSVLESGIGASVLAPLEDNEEVEDEEEDGDDEDEGVGDSEDLESKVNALTI